MAVKAIVLAVLIAAIALGIWLAPYFATGAPEDGMIKIRKGSTIEMATDSIAANIDTKFAERVGKLLSMTGADLSKRQGAFKVNKGDSPFKVMRLLRTLNLDRKVTVMIVVHDFAFAKQFASTTLLLKGGKLLAYGKTKEVVTLPMIRDAFNMGDDYLLDERGNVFCDNI